MVEALKWFNNLNQYIRFYWIISIIINKHTRHDLNKRILLYMNWQISYNLDLFISSLYYIFNSSDCNNRKKKQQQQQQRVSEYNHYWIMGFCFLVCCYYCYCIVCNIASTYIHSFSKKKIYICKNLHKFLFCLFLVFFYFPLFY